MRDLFTVDADPAIALGVNVLSGEVIGLKFHGSIKKEDTRGYEQQISRKIMVKL
ncbi:MAG: hypothetical protein RLZZ612_849 [Pseudomonadota bacterium]|jgi:hypothetical protein